MTCRPSELAVLWTLKDVNARLVRAVVWTHPLGMELRLDRDGELLQSQVHRDQQALLQQAREWREKLEAKGWNADDGSG